MTNLQNIPGDIARIDIEQAGFTTIFIRAWKKGFNPDDAGAPDFEELVDAGLMSMSQVCAAVEEFGFSITIRGKRATALRGPVTRIDFIKQVDGWHIKKYPAGWRAATRPMSDEIKSEEEIKQAIAWCRENDWIVRENPGHSRAWKHKLLPVHTREEVRRLRANATSEQRFADFAYDY